MFLSSSLLLAALPLSFAFSDTAPLIAWSSHRTTALDDWPAGLQSGSSLTQFLANGQLCESDAILVVDHPGLHASDLRNLPSTSPLTLAIRNSPSSRQFPYVSVAEGHLSALAEEVSSRCGARLITFTPEQRRVPLTSGEKHVVCMSLPHLDGLMSDRYNSLTRHVDTLFESALKQIADSFPNYVVLYSGTVNSYNKRQSVDGESSRPVLQSTEGQAKAPLPSGGIFKRYQLLNPALITVLLVAVFILFPLLFVGISALSSIQSPLRVEAPKGYSDKERKNQ